MNLQESIRRILREETEMLDFIFDSKTNKVIGFNLVYGSEEFNNILYDENDRNRGYGFGSQKDNFNNPIKFDSLEDAQKWYSDRAEKHLQKQTQNQEYSDLSYIAYNIRKIDDLDYQVINRGSCFKFAKEISKLGYNKFTFIFSEEEQEVIHVYVKLTNNLYFDANGFHTKKEIKNQYYVGEDTEMYDSGIDELGNFSDLDTYECLTTIPIPNNVWKKVIQVIKKSKMNLQESIRRILREENEGYKVKLVKRMIHSLYDEVSFIEQSTYNDKPLLKIYFNSDDNARNIESWFDTKISNDIDEYTSGNIVVCPTWAAEWDWRKKNADVYIETELLKYDNLGNVINESVLREEKELPPYFKRRINIETLEQIYQYVLKVVSKRYTGKKKQLNAMTPYKFNHLVTSNLIEEVSENFELIWDDDGERFNQLWDFLNDRYSERNIKHFYEIR